MQAARQYYCTVYASSSLSLSFASCIVQFSHERGMESSDIVKMHSQRDTQKEAKQIRDTRHTHTPYARIADATNAIVQLHAVDVTVCRVCVCVCCRLWPSSSLCQTTSVNSYVHHSVRSVRRFRSIPRSICRLKFDSLAHINRRSMFQTLFQIEK